MMPAAILCVTFSRCKGRGHQEEGEGGTRIRGSQEEWEETDRGQGLLKILLQVSQGHWIKGSFQMNSAIRVRDLLHPQDAFH